MRVTFLADQRCRSSLALLSVLCFFVGAISYYTNVDLDSFHEMALAREIWAEGQVPLQDVFAYTPTLPLVVHHEWGTGMVLYAAASTLGAAGFMTLKYLLALGIAVGCYVVARRRGASPIVFAVLTVIAVQLSVFAFSTIRAQLFTMFFMVCLLAFLERDERGQRAWIAVWLPLLVVWINLHGGFVVGVGLLGLHTIERFLRVLVEERSVRRALLAVRHLVLTLGVTLPMMLVNPWGARYVSALYHMLRLPRPNIYEWAPLWEIPLPGVMLSLFCLSLVLVAYAAWMRGLGPLRGILLVAVTAYLATRHIRHLPLYALVWLCYAPGYLGHTGLADMLHDAWARRPRLAMAVALLLGLLGGHTAVRNQAWRLQVPTMPGERDVIFPAGAVDFLEQHRFSGNVMVPFEVGAFVSWKLYPAVKVSFDSRFEVAYAPVFYDEIAAVYTAQADWQEIVTRYPTDAILVPRAGPLHAALERRECPHGWACPYRDDAYLLYLRGDLAASAAYMDRTGEVIQGRFP